MSLSLCLCVCLCLCLCLSVCLSVSHADRIGSFEGFFKLHAHRTPSARPLSKTNVAGVVMESCCRLFDFSAFIHILP